jgi:hypothetical protein
MKIRKLVVGTILSLGLFASGVVVGQNVSAHRYPNLFAAQSFIEQAIDKISVAQRENEFDLGGHGNKAKDLLNQAYQEVKLASRAEGHR